MSEALIIALFGSSVLVSIITLLSNIIIFKLNRKAQVEDQKLEDEKLENKEIKIINEKLDKVITDQKNTIIKVDELAKDLSNVTEGQMILLKKEIEHEASKCISSKKIKIKTREELHMMHGVYHNKLHGNGGLDSIMEDIDELPLEVES